MKWQSINYKYNIRGWLTDINNVNLGMLGEYQFPMSAYADLFSFKIMYNEIFDGTGNQASPLYNGNTAQTFWKTGTDNEFRGYDYLYDNMKRLMKADFYVDGNSNYSGAYKETIAYDLNDFRVKSFEKAFYEETERSSMILDRNKGIESITYNHLNLPTKVSWSNSKYISYQYNAIGEKVRKRVVHIDSIKAVEYLDGFQTEARGSRTPKKRCSHKTNNSEQYAGNVLQFFPTSEGYVKATRLENSQTEFRFNYIYNHTDHLGNVRVSYTLDPQTGKLRIVDEHHYYPFGLRHEVHYPSGNRLDFHPLQTSDIGEIGDIQLINVTKTEYMYRYNSKEWQDELGLNFYDYGARNYDAAIGRWSVIDPLAEQYRRWSPYTYAVDNPVRFIDPDGMEASDVIIRGNRSKQAVKELRKSVNGELKISRDKKIGKVTATPIAGKTLSAKSQKLLDATTDSSIKVQVRATNDKLTPIGAPNLGSFEYAKVSSNREIDGKKAVTTAQSINPEILSEMDEYFEKPGATTLHEVIESYIAGEMVQESGISSGNSLIEESVYDAAHKAASEIAPQSNEGESGSTITPFVDENNEIQRIEIQKYGKKPKTIWPK